MGKKKSQQSKPEKQKKPILADHVKKGRKLLPPLIAKLGDSLHPFEWIQDFLPEFIWLALLHDQFLAPKAAQLALECARETSKIVTGVKKCAFAFVSDYQHVDAEQGNTIRKSLKENGSLEDLQRALIPLISLYSECPMQVLFDDHARNINKIDAEVAITIMKRVLEKCVDQRGRESMIAQATAYYILCALGKIVILGSKVEPIDLNVIRDYPDTDISKKLGSRIRATLSTFVCTKGTIEDWCSYFWRHGYSISICEMQQYEFAPIQPHEDAEVITLEQILEMIKPYRDDLYKEIEEFWKKIPLNLARPLKDEVLGGLMARQARFAATIASDPNLWAEDIGRILIRCMIDTYITIVWLVTRGTEGDYKEFIEYGQGQDKLLREHLGSREEFKETMSELERHKPIPDTVSVTLGMWKPIYQMAEETGNLDKYHFVFSPFSNIVHGSWDALSKFNLKYCLNPLHRFHRIPKLESPPLYLGIVTHAMQITDESFRAWEKAYDAKPLETTASGRFRKALKEIVDYED